MPTTEITKSEAMPSHKMKLGRDTIQILKLIKTATGRSYDDLMLWAIRLFLDAGLVSPKIQKEISTLLPGNNKGVEKHRYVQRDTSPQEPFRGSITDLVGILEARTEELEKAILELEAANLVSVEILEAIQTS